MAPLLPEPARTRPPARYRDRIDTLTIGDLSARSGVAPSALRYYEAEGLIHATRTAGGQRRYTRDELRRVAFIRIAQQIAFLEDLKDRLTGCIGCGCLSMKHCHLLNPGDAAGAHGPGPRYLLTPTDR
jgi:MerR family redox-sensitive transcriptional activator SoxR